MTLTCWCHSSPWSLLRCFLETPGDVSYVLLICFSFICSDLAFLLMFAVYKPIEGFPLHWPGERYPPRNLRPSSQHAKPDATDLPNSSVILSGPTLWETHCVLCPFPVSMLHFLSCFWSPIACAQFTQCPASFFPFIFYLQPLPLMDSIVDTGCDTHSLISRHLNVKFLPYWVFSATLLSPDCEWQ